MLVTSLYNITHLYRSGSMVGPGALKPKVGDGIKSRRPLSAPVLHSFILLFFFFVLCLLLHLYWCVYNNNNNNNNRRLCRNCYKCARSFLLVLLEQSPKIDRFVRKSHFSTTSVYFTVASKRNAPLRSFSICKYR